MFINNGFEFENEFINTINCKKINEIPLNIRSCLKQMFDGVEDENSCFFATHCDPRGKPDVEITFKNQKHYISLKTGSATIVHAENIDIFISKLEKLGISKSTIEIIKKFQYGDGTTDGTGTKRLSYEELYPLMLKDFSVANEELNQYNQDVVNFVDKVVFIGNDENLPSADFIYHGNINFGVICSRQNVIKHLRKRNYDYMRNLHIGPIQFHPYARYVNGVGKHEYKRDIVNFKWINFIGDLEYIAQHY